MNANKVVRLRICKRCLQGFYGDAEFVRRQNHTANCLNFDWAHRIIRGLRAWKR